MILIIAALSSFKQAENVVSVFLFFSRIRCDVVQRTQSKLEHLGFARRRSLTTRRGESAGNATPLFRAPRELKSVKNVFRINKKSNNKNVMKVFVAYSKNEELCEGIKGFPSIVKGQRIV